MMPEPLGVEPINQESTASIIARRLRGAIMHGTLPPGSQLGESDLATRFGVSRGPLREAMQRLVQEGLLRSERNRGLFVITLAPEDILDIYTARVAVERTAVSLILRRDRKQAAARLAEVHAEMVDAAKNGDHRALSDADLRFHEAMVAESGSPRLSRMYATLLVESRICMTAMERTYRRPDELVVEHGRLVRAVRAGNEERLFTLIDAHADDALRRLGLAGDDAGTAPRQPVRRARTVVRSP
jgi:DNA-binding GntR family transcriptional regulator